MVIGRRFTLLLYSGGKFIKYGGIFGQIGINVKNWFGVKKIFFYFCTRKEKQGKLKINRK